MLSFLSGASRKSYFMTSWPDESLLEGSVTTLPAAPPTSQTQPRAAAKAQTSTAQPLVYCGKYVTVLQRAAVKSAQGTSKYPPWGAPRTLTEQEGRPRPLRAPHKQNKQRRDHSLLPRQALASSLPCNCQPRPPFPNEAGPTPPTDCPEACCYNQEARHSCRPQWLLQKAH